MEAAERILGMSIKGLVVQKVLVVPAADIASEAYVGLIMDRDSQRPVFMVSPAGGIDIEEVAAKTPGEDPPPRGRSPLRAAAAPGAGPGALPLLRHQPRPARPPGSWSSSTASSSPTAARWPEINPLVTTPEGKVVALDAKISIDDNELDRRPDLAAAARRERRGAQRGRGAARQPHLHQARAATSAAW